jgi:hypothetical protein
VRHFHGKGNFPKSKRSENVFENTQSTSGNQFFDPAVFYLRKAPRGCNCSAGNPPPRGNLGLKRTQTHVILKKFEFNLPHSRETVPLKVGRIIFYLKKNMPCRWKSWVGQCCTARRTGTATWTPRPRCRRSSTVLRRLWPHSRPK